MERIERRENGVVLEPRGHAKTTWANTILLSYLASKYPNIRIGLISNTATQSNAFSRAVRWTLETNEYQHEVWGNLRGQVKWNDTEWITKDSALHGTKDVTCFSTGAGGAIISKRFDLILCDDILDEENTVNIEAREKVQNWFWKTLKPCLAPGGSIIVIGTRWADGDMYSELIEEKKWPSLVKSALNYDETTDPNHEHPKALWPALWPVDRLLAEKLDMGSAMFACAYQNDISGLMEGNIFARDWLRYVDHLPAGKKYVFKMGVDLASSERERADYTARVIIAEDEEYNTYVLNVARTKTETGHRQFILDGVFMNPQWPMSRIVIENNQFQSALVKELINTTALPIVGKRADVDKTTRARAAAARYESGKVYHLTSLRGSDFETELMQFPKGHDDMIDALGHAMETGGGSAFWGSLGYRS